MEIDDILWLISNGFKLKEKILSEPCNFETRNIIDNLFGNGNVNDVNLYERISDSKNYTADNTLIQICDKFRHSFRNSPHNLKILVCYLIDAMLSNYISLDNAIDYPYYSYCSNKIMRLYLFPAPYFFGYKTFLYLYRLKVICTEKLTYYEWSNLLLKFNSLVDKCEVITHDSKYTSFDGSFNDFLITELERAILINEKPPTILNIIQNKLLFGNWSKLSIFLKGINLLKTLEMNKFGEQYLIKSVSIKPLKNSNFQHLKVLDDSISCFYNDQLLQIYCIVSMSMNSSDYKNSLKYIIRAERLIKGLSESTSIGARALIKIYVLISKLYILTYSVNARYGRFCLSKSNFNQFDCLPHLIISALNSIHFEILENAKFLSNKEQNNILTHLSEYLNYVKSDYPILLTLKLAENCSNGERSKKINTKTNYYRKQSLNAILPIYNLFSYLNTTENKDTKHCLFDTHSTICWTMLIPNFLLCCSEINSIHCENIYNVFLSQLANQLLYFVKILYASNLENVRGFPRVKIAEIYLFISLYSYFGKDETSKASECITQGLELLESCGESINVCSLRCIFAYLNLLIHLRSSNDISDIETYLRVIIRNGRMAFKCICPNQSRLLCKKKMANLAFIQALTLLSLLKDDFNLIGSNELNQHLKFECIKTGKVDESYIEGNIIISKCISIARLLNSCF